MDKKKKHDKIDIELSKTYFGGGVQKNTPKADPKPKKKAPAIILAIALVVIAAGIFFLRDRIALDIDIKMKPAPQQEKAPGLTQKLKEVLRPISVAPAPKQKMKASFVLYDFEKDEDGWEIPAWELDKPDHVARSVKQVRGISSHGSGSLELATEFPGDRWTAALVEIQQYLDLDKYDVISVDVYIPSQAPEGLRAKLILTVGDDWRFVEMARTVKLKPGTWNTIAAILSDGSMDWRRTKVDSAFRQDVRKVALRIESNKAVYSGPIYIDNISVYTSD